MGGGASRRYVQKDETADPPTIVETLMQPQESVAAAPAVRSPRGAPGGLRLGSPAGGGAVRVRPPVASLTEAVPLPEVDLPNLPGAPMQGSSREAERPVPTLRPLRGMLERKLRASEFRSENSMSTGTGDATPPGDSGGAAPSTALRMKMFANSRSQSQLSSSSGSSDRTVEGRRTPPAPPPGRRPSMADGTTSANSDALTNARRRRVAHSMARHSISMECSSGGLALQDFARDFSHQQVFRQNIHSELQKLADEDGAFPSHLLQPQFPASIMRTGGKGRRWRATEEADSGDELETPPPVPRAASVPSERRPAPKDKQRLADSGSPSGSTPSPAERLKQLTKPKVRAAPGVLALMYPDIEAEYRR